ncbi:Clavaminate synthase-like protein [Westerdykella ornata]|uniref:Clavaminate synthase-like protein n=1 Tax=Westerdykella ornata TaxID=318751 RepID=A0A6A6JYQ3_WESOR|nr:Clavaminate synthase-like protein [Westerdykella ornata]KAF2281335.1 Clavaminate synthase-like protein [Westerdykella ornata]
MSLKLTSSCAQLPLQSLYRHAARRAPRRCVGAPKPFAQPSRSFFWNSKKGPAAASPTSTTATATPTTPTFEKQQQQPQELPQHQEPLVQDAPSVGQLDGKPAKHVAVNIDGASRVFDTVFLRDSCACPRCVDPHSRQKLFQTSDIPANLEASCRTVEDADKGVMVEVEWHNDVPGYGPEHRTRHSIDWLRRALNTEVELRSGVRHDERVLWDRQRITKDNKWVDYNEYMSQDEALFSALLHLHRYGLLFLRNVPESEESVVQIASRIGNLKDTLYGRTWDVKSKPHAENIAYTQQFLGLHMDLLYTSNPPHLQLLHSLRARAPRGESFFSDSFHAAHQLHARSPFHFRTLCTFPVTYHYHHPPNHHYHFTRPTIELHPYPKYSEPSNLAIRNVNWSPPFQAPFEARIGGENHAALRNYLAAARAFEKLLSAEENLYEYRLEEGECVVFDNRRVLHARRAFDAAKGERWLKGAYVDDDVFFSRLRVLQERFEGRWEAEGVVREVVR